eukprot:CAMPEP_0198133942 /NCGR_PEP_ID=MMETSP1442-20131203/59825_1 /TAXON_ID= /ORGANISM="Craspedostauros australis, Strain CCMP3328" /LENGTH=276 /DNA_ID=CAMNT_0043795077 /DNA_START=560 /DNA_END=1390 /DNA_ORIENTATION=+
MISHCLVGLIIAHATSNVSSFVMPNSQGAVRSALPTAAAPSTLLAASSSNTNIGNNNGNSSEGLGAWMKNARSNAVAAAFAVSIATATASSLATVAPAYAYEDSDYASETVQETIQKLKAAAGNSQATFDAYEDIANIITEGRGVGGMINYQGIALERGFIADEDTTIYNPGLTLLTESEKERLVEAIIDVRKVGLQNDAWAESNEFAFEFLREKLDPFHLQELSGYLSIMPFYAAFLYIVVLGIQQFARNLFVPAYFIAVGAFFLPIVALVAIGP